MLSLHDVLGEIVLVTTTAVTIMKTMIIVAKSS
jgi:hypothetical protein